MSLFGKKVNDKTDFSFQSIGTDYEGIAKVLAQFVELYKVCDNKELLDKSLGAFLRPFKIPTFPENIISHGEG